jgi:hypothetical protein
MPSKVKNNLAILSYHEKRIQLEQEVQQRYGDLSTEAQAIVRDVIREFISRSAMPVRIIYAQKFVEELENKLSEKNKAFQNLSEIHERTLAGHNDQLDFTWKDGYEKGVRDANATHQKAESKPDDNKIKLVVKKPVQVESEKIQQLRLQLSTRESELDQQALELVDTKQKLLDQAKRHQQRVDELKAEIAQKPEVFEATLGFKTYSGHIVENWRDSWKWISNWCFGLIVFFATTPIPPEVLAVLPENVRIYLIAFTAFCGFVGRYINQTKTAHLPPIHAGDADV